MKKILKKQDLPEHDCDRQSLKRNRLKKFMRLAFGIVSAATLSVMVSAAALASTAVITGDAVNVRKEPNTDSTVLTQYQAGDSIDVISLENGWYKIKDSKSDSGFAYVTGDFVNLVQVEGSVNEDRVNIRDGSSTDHKVLGVLSKGDKLSVTGSEGDFYLFNMGGKTGYIYKGFVEGAFLSTVQEQEKVEVLKVADKAVKPAAAEQPVVLNPQPAVAPLEQEQTVVVNLSAVSGPQYGLVTSDQGVNFRKQPSQSSEVIFALPNGDAVDVLAYGQNWYKVAYSGVEGYIVADYLDVREGTKPEVNLRSQEANAIINFARKFIGTPYVWGGTNLNKGVDCSGFTYSVFRNFGYSLNRSSRDQFSNGSRVSRDSLLPGDLVFFDTNLAGSISHVGIYIGDGQFIHSCSGSRTMAVTINGLWESYYNARYYGATRIIR